MPQLIVSPTIDSTLDFGSPNTNFGQSSTIGQGVLIAGGQKSGVRRAIANFDVSAIPASAVIGEARLQRTLTLVDASQHSVRISRCTRPAQWTENGVTWNKYDGTTLWTIEGGDFDDVTPHGVSYVEAVAPGPHEISGLGGFVRDALDLRSGIVSLLFRNEREVPLVSERSTWLAASFWQLVVDYNVTSEPARRSAMEEAYASKPTAPRTPPEGQWPSRPSRGQRARDRAEIDSKKTKTRNQFTFE